MLELKLDKSYIKNKIKNRYKTNEFSFIIIKYVLKMIHIIEF